MKYIFTLISLVLFGLNTFAQTPEKMSYQAVIRDHNNGILQNAKVNIRIIIRQGTSSGSIAFSEVHNTTTNKNGLVSLQIGDGKNEDGDFSSIDWSKGPYFIETQWDPENTSDPSITGVTEILSVPYALHAKSADSFSGNGNEPAFNQWDKNAADDFSGSFKDLTEVPQFYNKKEVDSLVVSLDGGNGLVPSLHLEGEKLSISGGNSISFENWDTNAADDFSGNYDDLQNKPDLFSGQYADLQNKPDLYNKAEIDNMINGIEANGGTPQNLNLDNATLSISNGNSISFGNWDTDAADDFSGNYDDLQNKPDLFSGQYADLQNRPDLYNRQKLII